MQLKTGFTILRTAAKKLQLTICVLRKRNIIYFIRQKINNTLNTFFIRGGVVNRWNEEAKAAIKELEALTGNEWINPYEYDKERKHITAFTDEEASEMNERIDSGYYTVEAMQEHKEEAARKSYEKKRAEIIANCEKKVAKLEEEKTVKLYIIDSRLPVYNVIYYEHKKEVIFNWLDYNDKVSQDVFIDFLNSVDYSKLPDGVTFSIK